MRYFKKLWLALPLITLVGCAYDKPVAYHTCPDWSDNPTFNHQNKDFSNQGCAYYNNITAQVSDPRDLDKGNGAQEGGEGDRESAVMLKYMSGNPQTLPATSTSTR